MDHRDRLNMTNRTRASWLVYVLGALCTGAILVAFLVVGPPSESATAQSRIVKVQQGVVQSTVSGSGNIQPATQLDLGFKTAGVVQRIYVSEGQQVATGQLLAELNPQSTEVTLEQAKASLQAAEATLVQEEENGGETSSGQSAGGSSASGSGRTAASTASTASTGPATPEKTTPAKTAPATSEKTAPARTAPATSEKTAPATSEKTKQSLVTREANLASARAAVKSDKLTVLSGEEAVTDTKLYAPTDGTIVSLSGEVGETVSGGGTSKATSSSSSSSGSGSGSSGASAATRAGGGASSGGSSSGSSGSSSSSSSSSSFAVLSDLSTMQLVVPLSESEIVHVHVGQPATVTVEALEGVKLAAEVVSVATLSTSNSGVVSYDVTFQLDQTASGVKPGMSASAEVVVKQAEGVNVPTSAISGDTVTVVRNGKHVRQAVVTGLAGNSSTIVLSGLKVGEEIALPVASTSSATSLTSKLAGRTGGLGGGGGGAFFRGGG
jgi:multidrug efflux pump subunit AcrA (membrane-fusion protein)